MRLFYRWLGLSFCYCVFFTHIANGAEFFRRQAGTTTFAGNNTTVTIPLPLVDLSKSILFFSSTLSNNDPNNYQIGGEITDASTLTFERNGNTGTVSISWEVIEFESGVYVQRGSDAVPLSTNVDITLNCIDLSKSFVVLSSVNDGSTLGEDDGVTGNLTSSTNLRLVTGTTGATLDQTYWQVVEYQGAVVQKLTGSLTGTSLVSTIPTPVDMSKTMVLSNHLISGNFESAYLPRTELTATNQVTYTRNNATGTCTFVTYVVEFTDLTSVARGTANFGSGITTQTVNSLTTTASSAVIAPGNYGRQGSTSITGTDNTGHVWFTYELTSSTSLQIIRAIGTGSTASAPWQIVTFEDTGLQQNTFYSIGSGAWETNTNWSYTPDGSSGAVPTGVYPRRTNNVVIQNGDAITINNVTDNNPCSQSPDGLGLANLGTFTGSGDQMFYHTGDLIISAGGSLTSSEEVMLAGNTFIENSGSFTINEDIVNLGFMEISASAAFDNTDDLILSGNSYTIMDNTSSTFDDLYMDHTNALLCGSGGLEIGNNPNPATPSVQYLNGATAAQICSDLTITCNNDDGDCVPFTAPSGGFSTGNSGPGGVASTDGTSELEYWIDANFGVTGTSPITAWADRSGNGITNAVAGNPVLTTSSLNGQAVVTFDGTGDRIQTNLNINAGTLPDLSIISIYVPSATSTAGSVWGESNGNFDRVLTAANGLGGCNNATTTGAACVNDASLFPTATSVITSVIYDEDVASGSFAYTNGSQVLNFTSNHAPATSNTMQVGDAGQAGFIPYTGDIAEIIVLSSLVNTAKRIIIENYLDAKYHVDASPALVNDVYIMDNSANGDYDFEVAGIGQASDGSNHIDARGSGVVRVWNPNDLDNGEFMMWGHDNTAITATTANAGVDVDGTIIQERLTRIYGLSETGGDVGSVSISFNFSGIGGSPLGSNLRLLIDRDGDGFADNDVTPIVGTVSGGIAVFSNVNFQDGDQFTLGNTDASTPLPIELLTFEVFAEGNQAVAQWTTLTELNNEFFTLEKSFDTQTWKTIKVIAGAGTASELNNYQVIDENPWRGQSYYRIRQTDYDGKYSYSPIVRLDFQSNLKIKLYPNPTSGLFSLSGIQSDEFSIEVFNMMGQSVPFNLMEQNGFQIDLCDSPPGVYIIRVRDGSLNKSIKLIKR